MGLLNFLEPKTGFKKIIRVESGCKDRVVTAPEMGLAKILNQMQGHLLLLFEGCLFF